jgi:hypothetical protein
MDNFDWEFYIFLYDDLKSINNKEEALTHYINHGIKEYRTCNKILYDSFDYNFYISTYSDLSHLKNKKDAFIHYINYGIKEYRIFNKKLYNDFDWEFYTFLYDDLKHIKTKKDAYKHYLSNGINEYRIFDKKIYDDFDWEFYIFLYNDLKNTNNKKEVFLHYIEYGIKEYRTYNKKKYNNFNWKLYISLCNVKYITNENEAIKDHLINCNIKNILSNKDLKKYFDWQFYINMYDDLKYIINKEDALKHFLKYGIFESRICSIDYNIYEKFDWELYINLYNDLININNKNEAYIHYIKRGINEYRIFSKNIYDNFDWNFYLTLYDKNNNLKNKDGAYNHYRMVRIIKKLLCNINNINYSFEIFNGINLIPFQDYYEYSSKIYSKDFSTFITFIIPTIGRLSLYDTINSLLNLKYDNWKAIILFDGIKNNFIINDDRIQIFEIEKKGDISKAGFVRNIGFNYVNNSEWIAFLDDDDTISDDYITNLKKEILINNNIEVCIFRMIDKNNLVLPNKYDFGIHKSNIGISFAIKNNIIGNVLFKNDNYEDYYFLKELEFKNYNIVIAPYICYFVRCNPFDCTKLNKELNRITINFTSSNLNSTPLKKSNDTIIEPSTNLLITDSNDTIIEHSTNLRITNCNYTVIEYSNNSNNTVIDSSTNSNDIIINSSNNLNNNCSK